MKRKLLVSIVAVLLVVTMCTALVACSNDKSTTNTTNPNKNGGSSISIGGGELGEGNTVRVNATSKISFAIKSNEAKLIREVEDLVVVYNKDGVRQNIRIQEQGVEGKEFKVLAPQGGYASNWYTIEIDSSLSFVNYPTASKISFYVVGRGDVTAEYSSEVIPVLPEFVDIIDDSHLEFDTFASGRTLEYGDILVVESNEDNEKYAAYKILKVKESEGGIICTYEKPLIEDVYEALIVEEVASLGEDSIIEDIISEEDLNALKEAAMLSFNVGDAKIDIDFKLNKTDSTLTITMTIPDVIDTIDLQLVFNVDTTINLTTNLSLGSLINKEEEGYSIVADMTNVLTFNAKLSDEISYSQTSALDDVISNIRNMLKNAEEDDVKIKIFNWIIPIGEGVATVSLATDVVMNFKFSGELGVKCTGTVETVTTIKYDKNVAEGEKNLKGNVQLVRADYDSTELYMKGNANIKIGLKETIKLDILAGVVGIGVAAQVGNYNNIYAEGSVIFTDDLNAAWGFYLEGGIYYSVDLLYELLNKFSGSMNLVYGEKALYDLGEKYMVTNVKPAEVVVATGATRLVLEGSMKDLTSGAVVAVDATKVNYEDEFVVIKDGMVSLTEAGLAKETINPIEIKVINKTCTLDIKKVDAMNAKAGDKVNVTIPGGIVNAKVYYVGGDEINFKITGNTIEIAREDVAAGTIVVTVDGKAVKLVYVD